MFNFSPFERFIEVSSRVGSFSAPYAPNLLALRVLPKSSSPEWLRLFKLEGAFDLLSE